MAKELELKITDISKEEIEARLAELGAKYEGTYHFKRLLAIMRDDENHESWMRARTDGKSSVITFKRRHRGTKLLPMDKYQVDVDSWEQAVCIVSKASNKLLYFENSRIQYLLWGLKITIDKWRRLPYSL